MNKRKSQLVAAATAGFLGTSVLMAATPLDNTFTYQGRLIQNGTPVSDTCDFIFTLWDSVGAGEPPSGGNQIGGPQVATNVTVSHGLFTVELDATGQFGPNPYNGEKRWLQIVVRCPAGSGGFTALSPRQPIHATPYAQQTKGIFVDDTTGNVGIGTTDPTSRLDVRITNTANQAPAVSGTTKGAGGFGGLFSYSNSTLPGIGLSAIANGPFGSAALVANGFSAADGLRASASGTGFAGIFMGSVGIGTLSPVGQMGLGNYQGGTAGSVVAGHNKQLVLGGNYNTGFNTGASVKLLISDYDNDTNADIYPIYCEDEQNRVDFFIRKQQGSVSTAYFGGTVGIGTTRIPTGVVLAVDGKVLCEEVEVQLSRNWPDYVFEDDYELMPLDELDTYVREKRHLPAVPSADEVATHGIALGQMQATLLLKVEELTLYVVNLNRQLDTVKSDNRLLRRRISALEKPEE